VSYTVHEAFFTLQGEGAQAGRAAVFIRLAGCNLWSGREEDRASAICRFCDTKFVGGERLTAAEVTGWAWDLWMDATTDDAFAYAVLTGGEPMLQLQPFDPLVTALQDAGFEVAIETNGTVPIPPGVSFDWVTVSPKAGTEVVLQAADEVKVVVPQEQDPRAFGKRPYLYRHRFVQPKDVADPNERAAHVSEAVTFALRNPGWRLGLQTQKIVSLP